MLISIQCVPFSLLPQTMNMLIGNYRAFDCDVRAASKIIEFGALGASCERPNNQFVWRLACEPPLLWGDLISSSWSCFKTMSRTFKTRIAIRVQSRTRMSGLEVSTSGELYIKSTRKSQVRKVPKPLGPKGLVPWAWAHGPGPRAGAQGPTRVA